MRQTFLGSESNSTNSSTELRVLQRPPENTTNYFHYHIENLSAQHLFFDKEGNKKIAKSFLK